MRVPAKSALVLVVVVAALGAGCTRSTGADGAEAQEPENVVPLRAVQDEETGSIAIYREGEEAPIVTQNAGADHRPFLHPIVAPDGKGLATQYSPGHHPHQTGLYWGFTRVNGEPMDEDTLRQWFYRRDKPEDIAKAVGRDYFHNPGGDYWRRESASVVTESGPEVKWQTVYGMLDAEGNAFMTETQNWTMRAEEDRFILDLEWAGEARTEVSINEMSYGGMFLRMPWHKDIKGEAVNAARQRNAQAEGQRAMWVDVGMQVEGRDDFLHVAIFDHPMNAGFPQTWRVDGQLGVGPARARMGDWHIPEGSTEVIRHRLIFYTGDLNDLELTEDWHEYTGAAEGAYSTASLWGIAQQEARQEKFLTPEEAVDAMTVRDGFKVNAWASEPMITQPMAFAWDDRGRMWIAENRDYETRGRGFSGSGDSRILILEDTDRDGEADSVKVFAEGIPFPAALAVGFDGVFVGAPPHLLYLPDRDGDDVAEMDDAEILLTGWGIRDRHETINSFHWGPDGWLYGLEGFATPSKIRKPGPEETIYGHNDPFPADLLEADGVDINGGVWRYHPTKRRFEVVAHGFSNPWGIDYDAKGQIFITACVIPHLFHVVPGGIYHRQGGRHFNPHVYGDIRTIVDHRHRSAHGGARVYLSDAFPEEHHGRLFMANIHEHAVLSDELEPKGSSFVAHHGEDFLLANNAQWVGFSMEIGPGGDVYVLDWHDAEICGNDVQHKETGRIFRITPEQSQADDWEGRYDDIKAMSNAELVELQLSKSAWHARRARVVLQGRAAQAEVDASVHESLHEIFSSNPDEDLRLRAMWALHVTGGFTPELLTDALDDRDAHVRAWAIQLLTEDHEAPPAATSRFAAMADSDDSAVVRLYLAAALQRIEHQQSWPVVEALVKHGEDAGRSQHPEDDLVRTRTPGRRGSRTRATARQALPDPHAHGEHRPPHRRRAPARDPRHVARRSFRCPQGPPEGNARRARGSVRGRAAGQLGRRLPEAEERPFHGPTSPRKWTSSSAASRPRVSSSRHSRTRAHRPKIGGGPSRASPASNIRPSPNGSRPCWTNRSCGSPQSAPSPRSTEAGNRGSCSWGTTTPSTRMRSSPPCRRCHRAPSTGGCSPGRSRTGAFPGGMCRPTSPASSTGSWAAASSRSGGRSRGSPARRPRPSPSTRRF